MRIISEIHDYYDGVMAMDQDRETLYIRKQEKIQIDKKDVPDFPVFHSVYFKGRDYPCGIVSITQCFIGFCGKVYPLLSIRPSWDNLQRIQCFNIEDVDVFFKDRLNEEDMKLYYKNKPKFFNWRQTHFNNFFRRKAWLDFFDEMKNKQNSYEELFKKHNSPIFVYRINYEHRTLTINPTLKDLEFYRLFPAYQAYQELVMYLCNQTNPEKPIPEIDNETLIEIKGFDIKHSFRKPKLKKHR